MNELIIGGHPVNLIGTSLTVDNAPVGSHDSFGSVGSLDATFTVPEDVDHPLHKIGARWTRRKPFSFSGADFSYSGIVLDFNQSEDRNVIQISGGLSSVRLNSFHQTMPPFRGTLGAYLSAFMADTGIISETSPSIQTRPIIAPGWQGERWFFLKQFCAAHGLSMILRGNTLHFSPYREGITWASRMHDTGVTFSSQGGNDAQSVEVYAYNPRWVINGPVYPSGGWNEDVDVLTVNAGEETEYDLEIDGSLESITPPTMVEFVSRADVTGSKYTVVADDGLPIKPAMWRDRGGRVEVSLNEDSKSIKVKFTGARSIPRDDGTFSETFAIALASDTSGHQYSTLRISGTGILFNKQKLNVPTGVTPDMAGTEVGVAIDNPFIATVEEAYEAGIRAAEDFQGYNLSGSTQRTHPDGFSPDDMKLFFEEEGMPFMLRSVTSSPEGESIEVKKDFLISDVVIPSGMTVGDFDSYNAGLTVMETMLRGKGMVPGGN